MSKHTHNAAIGRETMNYRERRRSKSNNPANTNKNVCTLAVADALGCGDASRYLHNIKDLVYTVRKRYTVRSRGSMVKNKSVGAMRKILDKISGDVNPSAFIVRVDGHVLLLDPMGRTIVDTAPRKRDRRKILSLYVVY